MEAVAQRLAVHRPLLPPDSARRAPGLFQALQGVAVELQQVVGGGDQAPLRLGGRQPPAFEAVDAVMGSRRRIRLAPRCGRA